MSSAVSPGHAGAGEAVGENDKQAVACWEDHNQCSHPYDRAFMWNSLWTIRIAYETTDPMAHLILACCTAASVNFWRDWKKGTLRHAVDVGFACAVMVYHGLILFQTVPGPAISDELRTTGFLWCGATALGYAAAWTILPRTRSRTSKRYQDEPLFAMLHLLVHGTFRMSAMMACMCAHGKACDIKLVAVMWASLFVTGIHWPWELPLAINTRD